MKAARRGAAQPRSTARIARLLPVAAWLAVLGFAPGPVHAAAAGQDQEVLTLTLREALQRATQFNPQYRQALNRMALEEPQRRAAMGAFLPRLSVSYGTNQSFRRQGTAVDFFGNPIDSEVIRTVTSSYSNQSASVSLDILRGGGRLHDYRQARAQARVDRLSAERDLNSVLAEVQRQFLSAQRELARLTVEQELLASRARDFEVAQQRFELAAVGRSDLLGASLDLEQQRVTVRVATGRVEQGRLALRRAIGDPSLRLLDVEQQLPEPFDPGGLDVEVLVADALRHSPAVEAAKATRVVRESQLSSVKSSRWPTLSLTSSFGRGSYGPERTALFDLDPEDLSGSLGFNVSIPLFRQFQTTQQIANADIELRNAGEQVRQAELELEERVRARYVDLETAWANVRQRAVAQEVASERLRFVQEEYRLATRSIEELRTAIREQAAAQRDAVDQRYAFAVALLDLYEAAGIVAREAGLSDPEPDSGAPDLPAPHTPQR